ncbi:MAG: AraC family transcriptional regulator [Oliverpabstia sp.]|nr:AraC family transcriptional regulator [Oliverpabstia sp.]
MENKKYIHEVIIPNQDLPFKLFRFEGKDGHYYREKHWHRSIEIFAVFEGNITFHLNEEKYLLSPGKFIIVNSNEIHSVDSPEPNHTVVLQIPLNTFQNYYTGEQFIRFTHDAREQDQEMMDLIWNMQRIYEEKETGYDMRVTSEYFRLLYFMVSKYRELYVTPDMLKKNKRLNRLSQITSYIKEHYESELSLDQVAKTFGYSSAYLSRMFQKYAGINYKAYVQNVRVEKAYQELIHSEHTISEIALAHGFPNSKAMSRAFQKKYGIVPSEYRKMVKMSKNCH